MMVVISMAIPAHSLAQSQIAYMGLEPDIVTNYLSGNARTLGFVRVTVELMLDDADNIEIAEHHMPLLRAIVIEIIGRQPEDKVKSLTGREDIRRTILQTLQQRLEEETGRPVVKDVIFTKYLYQG
ncbi:flagellar basal body-associated protein FliL [Alteromonas sp. ASW11-36]|uniref:Flagellar protein FliL n=1 Tax=Alteromonas arenosi TaxID=3055817 RepID=A0ABT7SSU0_9ALTE|nr:flagellar basal body-associated protein FliL [Alteromonas sp. ASW11-36]MDM7859263.1 flagellar basal body-associated protein FliL [Alteromonas sp. ASW11-36]